MTKLRVLMLSDFESTGGAAIAASRLAAGLGEAGHDVVRVVAHPGAEGSRRRIQVDELRLLPARLRLGWIALPWRLQQRYRAKLVRKRVREVVASEKPDVISVHNLHGGGPGWDWKLVEICHQAAPVVWTLHDTWSFTGRCAYPMDCRKFVDGCDERCPTVDEYPKLPRNQIGAAWRGRTGMFARHADLVAVAPSHWLAREALAGMWHGHKVEVIANGLNQSVYDKIDPGVARQALGVRSDGPVLLAGAYSLVERWKGIALLREVVRRLSDCRFHLVTFGLSGGGGERLADWHTHLGFIDYDRARALAYCAADLFVHPSTADNLPQTIAESLACGTPVVALPVGGVPEMVTPGETGWLAREATAEALADTLRLAIQQVRDGLDLRERCRQFAEKNYNLQTQAGRYETLFRSLIDSRKNT
jgi:glycosyltransferase involved in cell wall biosynthesis